MPAQAHFCWPTKAYIAYRPKLYPGDPTGIYYEILENRLREIAQYITRLYSTCKTTGSVEL